MHESTSDLFLHIVFGILSQIIIIPFSQKNAALTSQFFFDHWNVAGFIPMHRCSAFWRLSLSFVAIAMETPNPNAQTLNLTSYINTYNAGPYKKHVRSVILQDHMLLQKL